MLRLLLLNYSPLLTSRGFEQVQNSAVYCTWSAIRREMPFLCCFSKSYEVHQRLKLPQLTDRGNLGTKHGF